MKFKKKSGKPFKSGLKVNTYKGTTINPNTGKEAYTFMEDDSIVDAWKLEEIESDICDCDREAVVFGLCENCKLEVEIKFESENPICKQ